MWHSLQKLAVLPDETAVYFGHEYTLSNARFALTIDPDNERLKAALPRSRRCAPQGKFTIPTTLALEKETNPFLRAADPAIRRNLLMESNQRGGLCRDPQAQGQFLMSPATLSAQAIHPRAFDAAASGRRLVCADLSRHRRRRARPLDRDLLSAGRRASARIGTGSATRPRSGTSMPARRWRCIAEDGKTARRDARHRSPDRRTAAGDHPGQLVAGGGTARRFTLVGCTVSPGFEFSSFEMAPPDWTPGG
jgi:hypothetical protein